MDNPDLSKLEASTQILIAEHARMTQLYLYNAEMGEKRTSLFLSVVSLGGAGLIGLRDVISLINSLFAGFLAAEAVAPLFPVAMTLLPLVVGLVVFLGVWGLQHAYEGRVLNQAEWKAAAKDVRFPMHELESQMGAGSDN